MSALAQQIKEQGERIKALMKDAVERHDIDAVTAGMDLIDDLIGWAEGLSSAEE